MRRQQHARLRDALLDAQYELNARGTAAVVLVATGVPLSGRTEVLARLVQWLNPKLMSTHALPAEPAIGPWFRWWQSVPALGRISVVYDGWYADLARCVAGQPQVPVRPPVAALGAANDFEALLVHQRVRLLKLHFDVARRVQRHRLHHYLADPAHSWRVVPQDLVFVRHYAGEVRRLQALREATDRPGARWRVIDGEDEAQAVSRAGNLLLAQLRRAIATPVASRPPRPARARVHYELPSLPLLAQRSALATRTLEAAQGEIALQSRRRQFRNHALAVVFEGMDAAGKSQAIRRVAEALDPRQYAVVPVGVPTPEERRYPYLQRFWRALPGPGRVALFDRSWYGRVLVERVEGLCSRAEWLRAYREIRQFEAALVASKVIVVKCWLSVGRDEQLARFKERAANPAKRFKVDPRDWQARRRWWEYQVAAHQMFQATDVPTAPWTIIPADDKHYARHAVVDAVRARLLTVLGTP